MASRDTNRKTENALNLCVMILVLGALFLVFQAKRAPLPQNAVLLNAATAEQLAQALEIETPLAERILTYRTQQNGFESTDQLLAIPLLTADEAKRVVEISKTAKVGSTAFDKTLRSSFSEQMARRITEYPFSAAKELTAKALAKVPLLDTEKMRGQLGRFVVRTPQQVFLRFGLCSAGIAVIMFLYAPWLRSRTGGDPYLIPLTLLLTGFGVVLLFSIKDPLHDGLAFEKHFTGLLMGLVVMTVTAMLRPAARLKIKNYQYVWVLAAVALVGILFVFGSGPDGVRLRVLGFQPVELVKLFVVFFLAAYLSEKADLITDASRKWTPDKLKEVKRNDGRATFAVQFPRLQDIGPVIGMFAITLSLFFVIRDLGPGVLLFVTFIAAMYLATGRGAFVGWGAVLLFAGAFAAYKADLGVFPTRVEMWLSPFKNLHPNGLQLGESYWAMASGGIEGSGLGLGMPGLITRGGSDLAFVSWAEETGFVGSFLVLMLYVVLFWRGIHIALKASSDFERMLAFGLTLLLGIQTLLILCGVTGIAPLTGLSLPFLSFGKSALIADFAIIGLLRGISAPPQGGVGRPAPRPETLSAARLTAFAFGAIVLFGVGIARVGWMQAAQANTLAVKPVMTPDADGVSRPHYNPRLLAMAKGIERGSVYDRKGRILATSRPDEIRKSASDKALAAKLIRSGKRYYPFGSACAHLVGYLDPSIGGPLGIEAGYDAEMRGFRRYAELLADYRARHGAFYRQRRGKDVHLTVDAELQQQVQQVLFEVTGKLKDRRTGGQGDRGTGGANPNPQSPIPNPYKKNRAAFVLNDPATGDVLAAATLPTFDPNTLTPAQFRALVASPDAAEQATLVNRATNGLYPPGSTFKIATAAAALKLRPDAESFGVVCNQVDPEIRWQANGKTYVRRNTRDDAGDPAFGTLNMANGFRVSSNIYFANLAVSLDPNRFRGYLTDTLGLRHVPAQAKFDADLPDIGYGQGRLLVSPVEMARIAGSAANAGKLMQSRYVARLADPKDKKAEKKFAPEVLSQAMSAEGAASLREMMRSVVTNGTARGVFSDYPMIVAGKTGTAQNERADKEPHSWFAGFAPYSAPDTPKPSTVYGFACVVENGGYGKRVAAVVCRDVLKKLK
ncbi:FtsW/RodA/SpoVE family cell cycle protein [Nostoc sp. CHAB 5824]|nr:FtsW/RodA/SpoVE family cell cycle protein [Nostoc sp. CHAB 5824]